MNETILAISLSVVASIFYKILGFDLAFDKNIAIEFILKRKSKNYISFIVIFMITLITSMLIRISNIFELSYINIFYKYFTELQISISISFLLSVLIYVMITFGSVLIFIKVVNRVVKKIKESADNESIKPLLLIWIFVVALHIGYATILYENNLKLLPIFLVFTFTQTYYLFLFNLIRLREKWISESSFVVIDQLTKNKYFSATNRITFTDNQVQIKSDNNMNVITNYRIEVFDSNLRNSNKANRIRTHIKKIKREKR